MSLQCGHKTTLSSFVVVVAEKIKINCVNERDCVLVSFEAIV